jgi:hypothetical protein
VKYGLASRETSFVAVEHRDAPVEGRAELRRVPVALTAGWGGTRESRLGVLRALGAPRMMMADTAPLMIGSGLERLSDTIAEEDLAALSRATPPTAASRAPGAARLRAFVARASRVTESALRPLDRLVALQRADGSWELDSGFAKAVSLKLRGLKALLNDAAGDPEMAGRALATAVALVWLEKHASGARGEWELLAAKAMAWLAASRTEPAGSRGWAAWLDLARPLV